MIKYLFTFLFLISASTLYGTERYVQNAYNVVVPQKVVQFDSRYFQGYDYYFSVGNKLKQEKQEEVKTEAEFYKGQVEMLLKILAVQQGRTEAPAPVKPAETPTSPAVPTPPVAEEPAEYQVTETDKKVYDIFTKSCSRCHGDTKQDGGLALIKNGALQLVDIYDRIEIFDRVYGVGLEKHGKTKMPKGGSLSDADVEVLRYWVVEESDRNRK